MLKLPLIRTKMSMPDCILYPYRGRRDGAKTLQPALVGKMEGPTARAFSFTDCALGG
jgi:hypothetical protein